jgi:hypothetical protein
MDGDDTWRLVIRGTPLEGRDVVRAHVFWDRDEGEAIGRVRRVKTWSESGCMNATTLGVTKAEAVFRAMDWVARNCGMPESEHIVVEDEPDAMRYEVAMKASINGQFRPSDVMRASEWLQHKVRQGAAGMGSSDMQEREVQSILHRVAKALRAAADLAAKGEIE